MEATESPVVGAAVTSFEVLEAVRTLENPGVSDIARHLDRSKSGIYKHLNTLTQLGYLTRSDDTYAIGLAAWALGTDVTDRLPMEDGTQTVESLAASIDHSVTLVLYETNAAYYVYQHCAPAVAEQIGGVGDQLPFHATAAGKVILAYLPAERVDEILTANPLQRFTEWTITDPSELRTHLETIRERRTAVEREERTTGITSVAAPITDDTDRPIGAITVVDRTQALDGEDLEGRMLSLVVNAARSVESAVTPA
ncbi:MAG: IclR family transcriptional regulator [Halobacteriales archaeon]|nr:IclR family transcriptional regulator [Halobacteriales archaeon]